MKRFVLLRYMLPFGLLLLIKTSNNNKNNWQPGCETITIENNQIMMTVNVDEQAKRMKVDFGNTSSTIHDAAIEVKTNREMHAENQLFNSTKIFSILPNSRKGENNLGYDIFSQNKMACLLDFDALQICNLSDDQLNVLVATSEFQEIKAKFKNQTFSFFVKIKWKEYEFIFDTAYEGLFKMPYGDNLAFLKDPFAVDENVRIYNQRWINFNNVNYSSAIVVSETVKYPRVGVGFIKGFNWLIDIKRKKVYVKKNTLSLDTAIPESLRE